MEKNNREKKKQMATKTVSGKKRKRIITNHDDDKKRSWSDLPYEILELIKKGLIFMDQVNFREVCKSWSCAERVPPLQQIPWLLVFHDDDNINDSWLSRTETYWNIKEKEDMKDSCKLVDPKTKKTYTIDANVIRAKLKIRNFKAMKVHESKYGWLLISNAYRDHGTLYLYSPFFSEGYNLIELPVLNCKISCATFTSNPLDKDCKILALNTNYRDTNILIYTYRCGQGGSWSSQNFECKFKPSWYGRHWIYAEGNFYHETGKGTLVRFDLWSSFRKWMYSEGNFYYVSNNGTVGKFDMVLGEWNVFPVLPLIALEESNGFPGSLEMTRRSLTHLQHYIVKPSDGSELFLISDSNSKLTKYGGCYDSNSKRKKYDSWRYSSSHHIHRLDLSSMIWEDLDSVGHHVLFIGDGYNSILNSSVLKSNGEGKDVSDKIYYCKDDELKYCSVHDYTLQTKARSWLDQKPYRKQNCSRHYGSIATKSCRKILIDPPPR